MDDEENGKYVLTDKACMQLSLKEFGIDVSIYMAGAVKDLFMELMINSGHIERTSKQA